MLSVEFVDFSSSSALTSYQWVQYVSSRVCSAQCAQSHRSCQGQSCATAEEPGFAIGGGKPAAAAAAVGTCMCSTRIAALLITVKYRSLTTPRMAWHGLLLQQLQVLLGKHERNVFAQQLVLSETGAAPAAAAAAVPAQCTWCASSIPPIDAGHLDQCQHTRSLRSSTPADTCSQHHKHQHTRRQPLGYLPPAQGYRIRAFCETQNVLTRSKRYVRTYVVLCRP
jgi:hypothetical protein